MSYTPKLTLTLSYSVLHVMLVKSTCVAPMVSNIKCNAVWEIVITMATHVIGKRTKANVNIKTVKWYPILVTLTIEMLIVKLTSCSMLSMRVGIFVRVEKYILFDFIHLVLVYFPLSSLIHPPCLAIGKVLSILFWYPDCTVIWSTFWLIC